MKTLTALAILPLLSFSALAADPAPNARRADKVPAYPISADVLTTLDQMVLPTPLPPGTKTLLPCQVSQYATNHFGEWTNGAGYAFVRPDMQTGDVVPSTPDPLATTLVTFFTMSDIHIDDKESPAQVPYYGYENGPLANSSSYSAIILYTTHVLDAAVQTVNALHKIQPFDCGIFLGDAANNNQYNELRWYIDVIDGKKITPSSGAHLGAKTIDYQKPYQAAGLDKSIQWYQAIGNHDQMFVGCLNPDDYIRKTMVGSSVLNLGDMAPTSVEALSARGFYMGVVDGTTEFGDIIDVGPVSYYPKPPKVAPDRKRHSLSVRDWMTEFLKTTSSPAGHGFTKQMAEDGFACYHFYPKANVPIKVIVLDDTDKAGSAGATLDYKRYNWLVNELDDGENSNELMIVCAHIPVRPYAQNPPPTNNPYAPLMTMFEPYSMISEQALLDKLHTYKNLIMWVSGHVHRNAITPQPAPDGDPEYGFWEVETPSLRDLPQEFRRFQIVRNSDNNISIFAVDVDPAVNTAPLEHGKSSPALISRSYAIATMQIFSNVVAQAPHIDATSGVYNAELVKQLSPAMQAKLAQISPAVSSFAINGNAASSTSPLVKLNNTVAGSTPTHYLASESSSFSGAVWLPWSKAPIFTMSPTPGTKTVYFKVKDGSGTESAVASAQVQ
jgi:metallophosphoesterase (TIGR03768 family)